MKLTRYTIECNQIDSAYESVDVYKADEVRAVLDAVPLALQHVMRRTHEYNPDGCDGCRDANDVLTKLQKVVK